MYPRRDPVAVASLRSFKNRSVIAAQKAMVIVTALIHLNPRELEVEQLDSPRLIKRHRLTCGDGLDNDCAGQDVPCGDIDGDGYRPPVDCDDDNPAVNPGAVEICGDGIDNNCDSSEGCDGDGDGVEPPQDCDDNDPNRFPETRRFVAMVSTKTAIHSKRMHLVWTRSM